MRAFPAWLLPAAGCVWVATLVAAPVALQRGVVPLAAVGVYQGASILCHQRPERSFRIDGVQLPVCGRCLGLYAAAAAGAVASLFLRGRGAIPRPSLVRIVLAVAALPIVLSVGLEWMGAIQGSNLGRFASAVPLGAIAGWLLQRVAAGSPSRTPLRSVLA